MTEMLWGLIHFRGPAFLPDLKRRPYPHYSFFDLAVLGGADSRGAETEHRSGGVQRQDRVRRRHRGRPVRRLRDAVRGRPDARHSDSRVGRRRFSLEPRHAAGVARCPHRARHRVRARRRSDCRVAARVVGRGRVRRHHCRIRLRRHAAVRRRPLDQHHAADARVVARVVRRRRISVLLRRAREAEDEAPVRPVRRRRTSTSSSSRTPISRASAGSGGR